MKYSGPLESQRLSFILEMAISKEAQMGKAYVLKSATNRDGAVSPAHRDEVVLWLAKLKCQFSMYAETLALAICLLDRFLTTVKARPKYLRCIAVSCFFLATKTIEEDERIPVLKVLARASLCGCSPAEILRMERIILDKLNWDLLTATPLDFLHIFHAVALNVNPQLLACLPEMSPSQHMAVLTRQLLQCMACFNLLQFKGSMLALAVISLEVEKISPDWLALTIDLLQKVKMDSSQLIHCRELVAHHLSHLKASLPPNTVYGYDSLKQTLVTCNRGVFKCHHSSVAGSGISKDSRPEVPARGAGVLCRRLANPGGCKQWSTKRKVQEMEVDNFFDGIKRLYNEEGTSEVGGVEIMASGCGKGMSRQDGSVSSCPPLQAVSVM